MILKRLRISVAVGAVVFAVSFLVRILNIDTVFAGGTAQFPPFDDLYHARRIVYSAAHFPRVLEFDPDRGAAGAFCPWPPLYDLAAGGAARLLGGRTPAQVLARAAWFPPLVSSLFAALLAGAVTARFGGLPGFVAGAGVALSLPLLSVSRLGDIDHHFLEPPLMAGIVAATLGLRGAAARGPVRRGLLFGLALAVALFVQTAFLAGAAVAFLAVFFLADDEPDALRAGALGFATASVAVVAYRLTRAPGTPDEQWFLGAPHAAALSAAAVACGLRLALSGRVARPLVIAASLLGGCASALAVPGAAASFVRGAGFFAGDPWFRSIQEFQPIFSAEEARPFFAFLFLIGGGAFLLVPFTVKAWRERSRSRLVLACFAVCYLGGALGSRRMTVPLAPLLAVAGAVVTADLAAASRRAASIGAALLVVGPALAGSLPDLLHPRAVVPGEATPMVRVALELQHLPAGRVLGPWSYGHLFDVVGRHPVMVDNFGAMLGRRPFEEALRIPLAEGEGAVEGYCRRNGVRFVVLQSPFIELPRAIETLGIDMSPFLRPPPRPGEPYTFTRRTLATFWWRAYYDRGRARPEAGRWGEPFRSFRLIYADPQPTGDPVPYRGPSAQIWELLPPAGA